jgi:hypothetical protein
MKRRILLLLPMLALAGCGQQTLHDATFYKTHKEALKKELAACKPFYAHLWQNPAEFDKLMISYKKTHTFQNHRIGNCMMAMAAENQEGDRALARSLAGGMTNSVMP